MRCLTLSVLLAALAGAAGSGAPAFGQASPFRADTNAPPDGAAARASDEAAADQTEPVAESDGELVVPGSPVIETWEDYQNHLRNLRRLARKFGEPDGPEPRDAQVDDNCDTGAAPQERDPAVMRQLDGCP